MAQGRRQRVSHAVMRRLGGWGLEAALSQEVWDFRVRRVSQWVRDFAGDPSDLRVLDLGAHEGAHSIALAGLGAEVVAIEGRRAHVEKARASQEEIGLPNLTVIHDDVRTAVGGQGTFDVVLCLGVLYHLPAVDACELLRSIASITRGLAIVETQVSLKAKRSVDYEGETYWGIDYPEDTRLPGASIGNETSFWLTKPSLLNLLTHVGFTSVAEGLVPTMTSLAASGITLPCWHERRDRLNSSRGRQ